MSVKSFYQPPEPVIGTYGAANLVTSKDLMPLAVAITRVFVPLEHRGAGIANEMMLRVLADADESHTTLVLEIVPDESEGLSYEALEAWYRRLGFKYNKYGLMVRRPK